MLAEEATIGLLEISMLAQSQLNTPKKSVTQRCAKSTIKMSLQTQIPADHNYKFIGVSTFEKISESHDVEVQWCVASL